MLTLSFDQATKTTGYAIFDYDTKQLIEYGHLDVDSKLQAETRMCCMVDSMARLGKEKQCEYFSCENVFINPHQMTSNTPLLMLLGAVLYRYYKEGIAIQIITASAWKSYCGIKSRKRAEQKIETIAFVQEQFGKKVTEDEADAIGQGWYLVNNVKFKEQ